MHSFNIHHRALRAGATLVAALVIAMHAQADVTYWTSPGECPGDLNYDGEVGIADLLILLAHWG